MPCRDGHFGELFVNSIVADTDTEANRYSSAGAGDGGRKVPCWGIGSAQMSRPGAGPSMDGRRR